MLNLTKMFLWWLKSLWKKIWIAIPILNYLTIQVVAIKTYVFTVDVKMIWQLHQQHILSVNPARQDQMYRKRKGKQSFRKTLERNRKSKEQFPSETIHALQPIFRFSANVFRCVLSSLLVHHVLCLGYVYSTPDICWLCI